MNKTEFYKTSLNITNTDVHGYTKYLHEVIKAWGNKAWWRSSHPNFLYSH